MCFCGSRPISMSFMRFSSLPSANFCSGSTQIGVWKEELVPDFLIGFFSLRYSVGFVLSSPGRRVQALSPFLACMSTRGHGKRKGWLRPFGLVFSLFFSLLLSPVFSCFCFFYFMRQVSKDHSKKTMSRGFRVHGLIDLIFLHASSRHCVDLYCEEGGRV